MIDQPIPGYAAGDPRGRKCCFSWRAVLAGALVAVGLSFLLNLFSLAIGLTAFNVKDGALSLAIGGFIGMLIGVIAIMFFAGWVSGYLARHPNHDPRFGVFYGLAAWCLGLVITLILASQISQFITANSYAMFNIHSGLMANKSMEMVSK